jgi:formylglycine-generating enzyme required for sulfatase activity
MDRSVTPILQVVALLLSATCPATAHTAAACQGRQPANELDAIDPPSSNEPDLLQDLNITLIHIPAGEFLMGNAAADQYGRYSKCEGPRHDVRISRDFHVSRFEITVRQFRAFVVATGYRSEAERSGMGCNTLDTDTGRVVRSPTCIWKSSGFDQTDDHPVVCVSWRDAVAFCAWLSQATGRHCRLPTEAEWEYCCRAGSNAAFSTGDTIGSLKGTANCGDQSLTAVCRSATATAPWADTFAFTAPVGSFRVNTFGLNDMHGNVGEWCSDWFEAEYYGRSQRQDPRGPSSPTDWHVVRGGSWYNAPVSCRSSGRHDGIPTEASTTNGFRIVVEIKVPDP